MVQLNHEGALGHPDLTYVRTQLLKGQQGCLGIMKTGKLAELKRRRGSLLNLSLFSSILTHNPVLSTPLPYYNHKRQTIFQGEFDASRFISAMEELDLE